MFAQDTTQHKIADLFAGDAANFFRTRHINYNNTDCNGNKNNNNNNSGNINSNNSINNPIDFPTMDSPMEDYDVSMYELGDIDELFGGQVEGYSDSASPYSILSVDPTDPLLALPEEQQHVQQQQQLQPRQQHQVQQTPQQQVQPEEHHQQQQMQNSQAVIPLTIGTCTAAGDENNIYNESCARFRTNSRSAFDQGSLNAHLPIAATAASSSSQRAQVKVSVSPDTPVWDLTEEQLANIDFKQLTLMMKSQSLTPQEVAKLKAARRRSKNRLSARSFFNQRKERLEELSKINEAISNQLHAAKNENTSLRNENTSLLEQCASMAQRNVHLEAQVEGLRNLLQQSQLAARDIAAFAA